MCVELYVLRDVGGDAGDGVHDVAREQGESAKDRDRDDGEDDAVLGHRLPIFTCEPVVELLHRCRPPWMVAVRPLNRGLQWPLHRPEVLAVRSLALGNDKTRQSAGFVWERGQEGREVSSPSSCAKGTLRACGGRFRSLRIR